MPTPSEKPLLWALLVLGFIALAIGVHVAWKSSCESRGGDFRFGYTSQGYAYYCDED